MNRLRRFPLVLDLGETWQIGPICCTDLEGNPLANTPVSLRIASASTVIVDAAAVSDETGSVTFYVQPSSQTAVVPGEFYVYATRAFPSAGGAYDQHWGPLAIAPSVFEEFPFTNQYPGGPPGPVMALFLSYGLITAANIATYTPLPLGGRFAVDTSEEALDLELPSLAVIGQGVAISLTDLTDNAAENPFTVSAYGSDAINGASGSAFVMNVSNGTVIFIAATIGGVMTWRAVTLYGSTSGSGSGSGTSYGELDGSQDGNPLMGH